MTIQRAWPDYVDVRFYDTGWTFRVGTIILRWNSQYTYTALSLERLQKSYVPIGGMSWREFRIQRKQEREAAALARLSAESSRVRLEIADDKLADK